jgi:hypothetical protein
MRILTGGVLLVALAAMTVPGAAKNYRAYKQDRGYVREAPVKDCTRINGRYGYYGNPWCTRAEQDAFDRWQANRLYR